MEQIIFILFLLSIGYGLKFLPFPSNFSQSLNLFVIYVSLPATILVQFPKITFNSSLLIPALIPYLVLILSIVFVRVFFKNESPNTKAALYLLMALGNTSFFGFPILQALVGNDAIQYGIVYDQFGSFVILTIYAAIIVAIFSGESLHFKQIGRKIITFPPFIFIFLALVFGEMPQIALPYIELISKTLVPLAIISVGFSMQLKLDEQKGVFFKFMALKLLLIPMIVFGIFKLFDIGGVVGITTLLESAMPPMITAGAIAINAGFAPKLTASLVGYGIIFAFFTLSFFNYIF
ncbi:MAG: AEC family transporter [Arcobacteraceae bacterium]|nr:AEC family transporter [Arcobacteraceae bacterium]